MARKVIRSTISILAIAVGIASCSTVSVPGSGTRQFEKKLAVVAHTETHGMDPIATAAFWGTRFDRAPNDPNVAVQFSRALRAVGNEEESLRVIQHSTKRLGDDPDLLLELGKALIANDRAHEAARHIQSAIVLGKNEDWSAYSAYGVALDKMGDHAQAIIQYDRALAVAPNQAQVLNNKGLSYALAGKRGLAERTLRTATSVPGGTARIRQNLALVLALSGDTASAERLARSDLPPTIANGNVAYYRSLVSQPAYWQGLNSENAVQPDFGDDPSTISHTPIAEPILNPGGPTRLRQKPQKPAIPAVNTKPAQQPDPEVSASAGATGAPAVAAASAPVSLPFEVTK